MANNTSGIPNIITGDAGTAQSQHGITTKAFVLNLSTGVALFAFEIAGFFLLKNSSLGRRIYQPKTYLVQERLRVENIPVNPLAWIKRICTIQSEELILKCGLDGYFSIRYLRAMIAIFLPLMVIIVSILIPVNYHGGKGNNTFLIGTTNHTYDVRGLDRLSWTNVAPTETDRYWAHLVCALLAIIWTLYRIYREKLHFIQMRQQYLTSPEHRLKASARTILVTNIPSEFRSEEALKALFDVFVDNDDRDKLHVWLNRDYGELRKLVQRRRKLCHALEKEELRLLRLVNKQYYKHGASGGNSQSPSKPSSPEIGPEAGMATDGSPDEDITTAFEQDCQDHSQLWHKYLKDSSETRVGLIKDDAGDWNVASSLKFWQSSQKNVPKIAWLRAQISHLTVKIEAMLLDLDGETRFPRQNSAFIQFDRQMAANMAVALTTHHRPGCMNPRFLHVAPHEILWPNMGLTSVARFVRLCIALTLFVGILFIWGVPATFLGILSQLSSLRNSTSYLAWLKSWPSWIISLISGPLVSILLSLLIKLIVPALCRKLAVLVGAPTRSRREVITQSFYFAFLFIELVLVTSISSGLIATVSTIIANPTTITNTLATDLPKAANYFFNYLIIQALGFSGSVLFQYLRLLYITTIWPWFTQTPRQEAWLQTTIPHQMWANVFAMWTNLAAIGLIYSIIAPLMLVFVLAVFGLFWIAYRHNYYYVQRNKVDTYGKLFENALSQLFSGVYVLEISLIGLFFLVRDSQDRVVCTPQAIIMIVALALTAAYHYALELITLPLSDLVPVTLEDKAVEAEKEYALQHSGSFAPSARKRRIDIQSDQTTPRISDVEKDRTTNSHDSHPMSLTETRTTQSDPKGNAEIAADARETMLRVNSRIVARLHNIRPSRHNPGTVMKHEMATELGESIARYPDKLTDLSVAERNAELKAAYQDPVTREPRPIIWIPHDAAAISEDSIKQAEKYGKYLEYSSAGAYLTKTNKCRITQPAPDVRSDWLLDWAL